MNGLPAVGIEVRIILFAYGGLYSNVLLGHDRRMFQWPILMAKILFPSPCVRIYYFSAMMHSFSMCSHTLLFGYDMMHSVSVCSHTLLFGYDAWTIVVESIMNGHNFVSFSVFAHITFRLWGMDNSGGVDYEWP
jgi:hypothetical protein